MSRSERESARPARSWCSCGRRTGCLSHWKELLCCFHVQGGNLTAAWGSYESIMGRRDVGLNHHCPLVLSVFPRLPASSWPVCANVLVCICLCVIYPRVIFTSSSSSFSSLYKSNSFSVFQCCSTGFCDRVTLQNDCSLWRFTNMPAFP